MILDGKVIAEELQAKMRQEVSAFQGRAPCLAVILVGNNEASAVYVNRKTKACEKVGIRSIKKLLPDTISQKELLDLVRRFNEDPEVDGILVQLPLPKQIDPMAIIFAINPEKDVDGFHPVNMGKVLIGDKSGFVPCTPLGVQRLLMHSHIDTNGKNALVLGRSNIVGKPMAALLMQPGPGGNATVTVAHSKTKHLPDLIASAEILIAAMGQPHFVKNVKEGAVVIDVGMNRLDGELVGDVDFEAVKDKCSAITPVPGGVGPMTIAMLLNNTLESYRRRCEHF